MRTSRSLIHGLLAVCALLVISTAAFAADPGLVYPAASEVSDQKAGSVLFYNTYTSSASAPAQENTPNQHHQHEHYRCCIRAPLLR